MGQLTILTLKYCHNSTASHGKSKLNVCEQNGA